MSKLKILKVRHFILLFMLISLFFNSCQVHKHENFNRQKYLKGQIKTKHESEAETKEILSENYIQKNEIELNDDVISNPAEETQSEKSISEKNNEIVPNEVLNQTEDHTPQTETDIKPQRTTLKKPLKKKFPAVDKYKNGIKKKYASNGGGTAGLIFALIILALVALPFALLIGFWAFIIAGGLLLIALLLTMAFDPFVSGGGFVEDFFSSLALLIVLIFLITVLIIAAIVALIWFIIWGIIQLVN